MPGVILGQDTFGTETYGGYFTSGTGHGNFPALILEEAFTTAPFDENPEFVQLDKVRSFDTKRGRSSDLDREPAGTATFIVDVRDRVLDPSNEDSPLWPNVVPNRRIRLQAIADGVTWPVFDGYVDAHNVTYRGPADAYVTIPATDMFKLLARAKLSGSGIGHGNPGLTSTTGQRLGNLLFFLGLPSSFFGTHNAGVARAQDIDSYDQYALDAILDCDITEGGRTFIDADGKFMFYDRAVFANNERLTTPQATFSDVFTTDEIPYSTIEFENSETLIRNSVEVSAPDLETVIENDDDSIERFGQLTYQRSTLDASTAAMTATARHLLALYKDPLTRVLSVTVPTSRSTAAYATGLYGPVLALKLQDRVVVERRPPGGGDPIVQECFVQSIAHQASAATNTWTTTFEFAYAPQPGTPALWGSGEWDNDTWGY